jgi:WD40 repeat protein
LDSNTTVAQLWDMPDPQAPRKAAAIPLGDLGLSMIDDYTLAVAGAGGTVQLYDVTDADQPAIRAALATGVPMSSLTGSPNHQLLLGSSFSDEVLHLWQGNRSGQPVFTSFAQLPKQDGLGFPEAEFSPDGSTLAASLPADHLAGTFAPDGATVLWDLNPDRIYHNLCTGQPDVLTASEWKKYFPALAYRQPCL